MSRLFGYLHHILTIFGFAYVPDCCRYFTWDAHKFPSSKDMLNGVAIKGRKMVTIVDPHLKRDDNYKVYADAKSRDMMVKGGGGEEYEGWCWPGKSSEECWPNVFTVFQHFMNIKRFS